MNVSDSELVETLLVDQGFQKVDNPDKSDILFVNTCSIREHAEDKVHSLLGRYNLLKRKKQNKFCILHWLPGLMRRPHGHKQ